MALKDYPVSRDSTACPAGMERTVNQALMGHQAHRAPMAQMELLDQQVLQDLRDHQVRSAASEQNERLMTCKLIVLCMCRCNVHSSCSLVFPICRM